MASKRLNVLVYSGPGSTIESVRHCLYSLRRLLSPNYAVYSVTGETILKEPWVGTCALLVMPGGADLPYCRTLNGEGNRRIRQYVHSGGAYVGFCAGGYYASSRCEFEVGNEKMEVVGDRELEFYPDVCRGPAFSGFQYGSESGTKATELRVETSAFPSSGGILPQVFRAYANGGSVFLNASKHKDRGVEVLASYTQQLNVDSGEGAAAVVFCKVGEGCALLTGPHPEFAAVNLSKTAKDMNAAVVDALAEDDKQRSEFLKACLLKLGLRVNQDEQTLPSLSAIHFSSPEEGGVVKVLTRLQEDIVHENGRELIKGQHDTFDISRYSSTWSMSNMMKAVSDATPGVEAEDDTSDKIVDYDQIVKHIVAHEQEPPSAKETPYFNHAAYFSNLEAYQNSTRNSRYGGIQIGNHLMYGEVVTSTSTLLEKNPNLTSHLPTGTTFTATSQLSGRGRGSNVWISPAGSLMFSFILRHRLVLNATAPVVFIQYLAALAVAEGIQSYDLQQQSGGGGGGLGGRRSAYKDVPVKLKWPNDIYALDPGKAGADPSDRNAYVKVGGILVNSSYSGGDYTLIVGIGLNVSNAAPTTSLNAVLAATTSPTLPAYTPEKLLARILTSFSALYATFCRSGFSGELERLYYTHWLHTAQTVTLETEGGVRARVLGITGDWGLLKAEEVVEGVDGGERGTGRVFALQTDSNSFDFFRGLIRRKI